MRIGFIVISLVTLLSSLGPSSRGYHAAVVLGRAGNASGELECAFKSYQQCMANKPGSGDCLANPEINPLPAR